MNLYQNDPYNFIGKPEYFLQYHIWLLIEYKGTNIQTSTTLISNTKKDGGSTFYMFTDITIFNDIKPVHFNVQIINGSKAPAFFLELSS